jgi:outer membrane lipoprotein-sorting protein
VNRFNLIFLLVLIASPLQSAPSKESSTIDLIQKAWDEVSSYQAEFKQVIKSKTLGTHEESEGRFFVVKPGKLRWEPSVSGTTQILNGNEFWQIRQSKRRKQTQVDHYSDISSLIDLRSLTFLSGKINIKKSHKYRILKNDSTSVFLALSPLASKGDTILAEILKPSYLLGALKLESPESETRIEFKNIQTNVSLKDSLFTYQPNPQDIVHHHQR